MPSEMGSPSEEEPFFGVFDKGVKNNMPGAGEFLGIGVVWVGEKRGNCGGGFAESTAFESSDELLLEGGNGVGGEVPIEFHDALVNSPSVCDDDDEDASVGHLYDFHVLHAGTVQGGVLDDGDLLRELTEETDTTVEDIVDADGVVEESADGGTFGAGERFDLLDVVDEFSVALFGGYSPG